MSAEPIQLPGEGWRARLELQFQRRGLRTVLSRRNHRGPLLVQRVFYPESDASGDAGGEPMVATSNVGASVGQPTGEPCHVYVIHPPGGVVSGDQLELDVDVQAQAHALLTTPATGKFYRRHGERVARQTQNLRVDDGVLEWLPQENIYYPDSAVALRSVIRLYREARFIGWEIGCLGLPANQRSLGCGNVRQSIELWRDDAPLLLERLHIDQGNLLPRYGLAGHSTLGTWLACPADASQLALARSVVEQLQTNCADLSLACTLVDGVLCCRGLAARADHLKQSFIRLWSALRESLVGRPPKPPRIWMT